MTRVSGFLRTLVEAIQSLPGQSRAFLVVSVAVAALVVLSVLFTACAGLLRVRSALRQRKWHDQQSRWTRQILEFVAGERPVQDVVARVGRRERLTFLDFLLRYAHRLRGKERDRIKEIAEPFLPTLDPLLKSRDPYRRARAVQALGTLGSLAHRETLVKAVSDRSAVVSMLAARALAAYGGTEYVHPILSNLDRFEAWGREYVESLLVSLGPQAAPELRDVLADERRVSRVRVIAVDALRELHDLEAVPTGVSVLRGAPDADLTAALLRMLRVLGGPEHLDVVRGFLDHEHFAVRAEAYSALGTLGVETDEALLEEGLEDSSPWVVLRVARALRERGQTARLRQLAASDRPAALAAGQVLAEE